MASIVEGLSANSTSPVFCSGTSQILFPRFVWQVIDLMCKYIGCGIGEHAAEWPFWCSGGVEKYSPPTGGRR